MSPAEWYEVCAMICDRWPEQAAQRGPKWADAWWPDVKMFEQETLYAAVRAFAAEDSRGFPPDGGQLVRRAAQFQGGGADFDEAWREVLEGVRKFGSYVRPEWSSEHVSALVHALGGLRAICMMQESQMPTIRAQARDMWAAISKREVRAMLGIERRQPGLIGPVEAPLELPDLGMDRES